MLSHVSTEKRLILSAAGFIRQLAAFVQSDTITLYHMSTNYYFLCFFAHNLQLHIAFASKIGCKRLRAFMKLGR